jgi:branched-chain amino acid transport system substrate-binding protein
MRNKFFLIGLAVMLLFVPLSVVFAKSSEPIVLGAVGPLSAITGRDCLRAVELAVEEINGKGGVLVGGEKRPFKIVSADTRDTAPGVPITDSIMAYEKVILEYKPTALVINCHRSEAMLASMDLIAQNNVPTFMSICVSPAIDQKIAGHMAEGKLCFFHTSINVIDWARMDMILMDQLKQAGFTKVYGIYADNIALKALWDMVAKGLERTGLAVVGADALPIGVSDFSPSLLKAKKGNADLIWSIYETAEVGILSKQWVSLKVPALLLMAAGPLGGRNAWKEYGDIINGVVIQVIEAGHMPLKKYPPATEFAEKCQNRWSDWICGYGHGPADSYDSVYILADAIERAGTLDKGSLFKAIEQTDMKGVSGRLRFDKGHKIIYGADPNETAIMNYFQWQNGVRVPITPPSIAEGKIILPAWMKK